MASDRLSLPQRRLLKLASSRPVSVRLAADLLDRPVNAVSDVRNSLLRFGLVEQWKCWDDPVVLTEDGRHLAEGL